ncbi:MAG: rhodanese-like domain-containing protein [Methylococcales bacterium]|jgi:rhodanese-related sulfurtransferase|nr:rhodanese-like domain-containing protein [Methylococcales bacterium]MBT7411337.1 rhodanese-like domain-containing protein [Methylococcales bacterium]
MIKFIELIKNCMPVVDELFPWDVEEQHPKKNFFLLDVREPYEFEIMRIKNSINVPRGILESAVEYGYEETVPELVEARNKEVLVICRAGNRSLLAAQTMTIMGYRSAHSLQTGLKGWVDYELELVDNQEKVVDIDTAEEYFEAKVSEKQLGPKK